VTFGLARLFFAQPGGASGALSEFDSRSVHLYRSSSSRFFYALNQSCCAQQIMRSVRGGWLSELQKSTSPNFLILPEIEMERLLNTQKWDTKYLLPKFTKSTYNTTKRTVNGRSRIQFTQFFLHKS